MGMEEETLEEIEIVEMVEETLEERETLVGTDAEEVIGTLGIGEEVEDLPIVDLEMTILEDLPVMMTTAVDPVMMTVVDPKMKNAVDPLVIDQPEIKMTAGRRSTSVRTS